MSEISSAFLLVDKPGGWTSHDVVAKVRGLLRIKKVGHAGTLDPMATGLLVLGLGRATRLLRFVQEFAKEYVARVQFGVATDSLDADGSVLSREPMPVGEESVRAAMARFVGPIMQQAPMVSARKVEGRRLYELAREGKEVEREARPVTIHELDLIEFAPSDYPEAVVRVVAGKGTYVRTLADDIARALGGRAHLTALRRVRNGGLDVRDAHSIDAIEAAAQAGTIGTLVLDPAAGLADLPSVDVDPPAAKGIRNGVVMAGRHLGVSEGLIRVTCEGELLAVYRVDGPKARAEVVLS